MPGWGIVLVRPVFRYSVTRDAYVLRVVGRRHGPVLTDHPPASSPHAATGAAAGEHPPAG